MTVRASPQIMVQPATQSPRPLTEVSARTRRLPALEGLRAFEVASRHLSFTDAAAELFVTQGAVSQRIKALEHELGVTLFRRSARGLSLTREGERLSHGVRTGLGHIADAVARLSAPADDGALTLSVLPSFAARWLIPRLHRLADRHPDLHVQVIAEPGLTDLHARRVHGALRFTRRPPLGLIATLLMHDTIAPVCSPGFLAHIGSVAEVGDLAHLPILHDLSTDGDGSGTDWRSWLAYVGHDGLRLPSGQGFSQADLTIEAAASGLGIALARTSLVLADFAANRLVRLPFPAMPTPYSYYLLHLPEMEGDPRLLQLREWLLAEAHQASSWLSTVDGRPDSGG